MYSTRGALSILGSWSTTESTEISMEGKEKEQREIHPIKESGISPVEEAAAWCSRRE